MGLFVIAGVLARYVFKNPIHWVDEYNGYLMALVTLLPLAWVLMRVGHIRLTTLTQLLPKRAAKYLEIALDLVSLGIVIILLWGTTQLTIDSFVTGRRVWSVVETPLGPVQLVMPIGLGLFAIAIIASIIQRIRLGSAPPKGS